MRKAEQFFRSAGELEQLALEPGDNIDAVVSLYVLAGIAASDVICCAELKVYSRSESHAEAVKLLATADETAANNLRRLLETKSKAEYTPTAAAADDLRTATRAARALLERARRVG